MLTKYIDAAMRIAQYKILPDDGSYYGEIPGLQGVWANADTLEECRDELQSGLEDWLMFKLELGHAIPGVNGVSLSMKEQVA